MKETHSKSSFSKVIKPDLRPLFTICKENDFIQYAINVMMFMLEINNNGWLKWEYLKFSSLATKTYLHYHNVCGHQTWQGGELPWGSPTHKIIWPFDHMVLQDHGTN